MSQSEALSHRLIIGGIATIGVLWSYSAYVIIGLKDQAWDNAIHSSENLLHSVELTIDRDIELYNLSLDAVIDGLKNPAVEVISPNLRQLVLFDRSAQAAGYGSIFVLNQHGDAYIDSGSLIPRKLNGSDRKYFSVHKDHDIGLFVGAPWKTRVSGRFMIPLSRRIASVDGGFAGAVVGAIEMSYFQTIFKRFNSDPNIHVDLVFDEGDGVKWSQDEEKPFEPAYLTDLEKSDVVNKSDGTLISSGSESSVSRLNVFSKVGRWPIHVNVSTPTRYISAKWQSAALTLGSIVAILSLSAATLLIRLRRELLRRALIENRLHQLSVTDPLTEIFNRRQFDEDIRNLKANNSKLDNAILYLDVDYFKLYNDAYGHPAGDAALRMIASVISKQLYNCDAKAYRIGGEEFAIVLYNVGASHALLKAEEIRRMVERTAIKHAAGINGLMTVSIGLMLTSQYMAATVEQWLSLADESLYRAKNMGRNRVNMPLVRTGLSFEAAYEQEIERIKNCPAA